MTWKQLETMREVRLMLVQVVAPTVLVGAMVLSNDDVRAKLKETTAKVKAKFTK